MLGLTRTNAVPRVRADRLDQLYILEADSHVERHIPGDGCLDFSPVQDQV